MPKFQDTCRSINGTLKIKTRHEPCLGLLDCDAV